MKVHLSGKNVAQVTCYSSGNRKGCYRMEIVLLFVLRFKDIKKRTYFRYLIE